MVSLVYANIRDIRRVDGKFIPTSVGGGGTMQVFSGIGSPEGVLAAGVPSIYFDITTPTAPVIYWKTTGSGNTGWVS